MKALIGIFLLFVLSLSAASQADDYDNFLKLTEQVGAVSAAGKFDESSTLARFLLRDATAYQTYWNYGNAVHVAHLALGRAALSNHDLVEAEKQLLLSVDAKTLCMRSFQKPGATPIDRTKCDASPQMDSFGPDMLLAKELLAAGRKDAVLKYLELCAEFWKMDDGHLIEWQAEIKKGSIPDFGANLIYFFPEVKPK